MIWIILQTALFFIVSKIVYKLYLHYTFWQRQGIRTIPYIPIGWAFKPVHEYMDDLNQRYGSIFGVYKVESNILVVNDPRLVRELSIKEFHKFPIRNSFHAGTGSVAKSLFLMEANDDWKRIRSIITPAFTSGKLRGMLTPIERITGNFIQHLRPYADSGELFDLKRYVGGFTMDVIASCCYGIELDSLKQPNHPVVVNAKKILNVDVSVNFLVCFLFPTLARWLRLEAFNKPAQDYFDELTFRIVEQRLALYEQQKRQGVEPKKNQDFLGLLIDSIESNQSSEASGQKSITKTEMAGQGILFFIAGFDTIHATIDHVIYYLTQHPEWQQKLYEEIYAERHDLNYDKLTTLPILNAIICETLRLRPPLFEIHREAKEACELLDTGIKLEKNTTVVFHPYILHRNPDYFPEPLAFKPERFLNASIDDEDGSLFAYMPFGVGPRQCVGMRFAQNELRIGLANFVLNYRVSADSDFKLEYYKGAILMSPKRIMVRIAAR